ncbi:unnamed protein product, partial [Bubo scandiacus]
KLPGLLPWDHLLFHMISSYAGITDCSTRVADAASAREYQKPPIIISLQKICSQGHRPIRQA